MHYPRLTAVVVLAALIACVLSARAIDEWPQGGTIVEGSLSPDGRFGVLLPSREAGLEALESDEDGIRNTLVDIKSHDALAVIRNVHYFPGANHRDLDATWAPDSGWCAVTYGGRYGFQAITLLKKHGSSWEQVDIGTHIQKALDADVARQARKPGTTCSATAYFRAGSEGNVLVRASGMTNPKGFPEFAQNFAVFLGTYDSTRGQWIRSETREVDDADSFDFAFSDSLDGHTTFPSQEARVEWFDARLNDVWNVLGVILPPKRFAALQREQRAWLEKLQSADSTAAKTDLIAARIKELRVAAW